MAGAVDVVDHVGDDPQGSRRAVVGGQANGEVGKHGVGDVDDDDLDVVEADQNADRGAGLRVQRDDGLGTARGRLARPPAAVGFDYDPRAPQFERTVEMVDLE